MKKTRSQIVLTLILNLALPYLVYKWMLPHTDNLTALTVAAVVPLLDTLYSLIRTRKADGMIGLAVWWNIIYVKRIKSRAAQGPNDSFRTGGKI